MQTSIWVAAVRTGSLASVQLVAARARHIARGMSARCPIMRRVRLMAAQALRVLLACGRTRLGAEVDHARQRAAARLHMCAARPVAGLALQTAVTEGPARIVRTRMLGAEDARDRRIVMTAKTGVRSLRAVGGIGMRARERASRSGRCGRRIGRERVHSPAPSSRATAAATQARANRRTQFAVAGMLCTTLTSATPPAPWHTLQVSTFAGFVLRIVRPSASFVTVVEPPFCCMCAWVRASTWHAEHTDILAEVEIGLPTVVGLGDCFDRPVINVVACTAVSATG